MMADGWLIGCADWNIHTREYYECSRYKANPMVENKAVTAARLALKKYIHYYERVCGVNTCSYKKRNIFTGFPL